MIVKGALLGGVITLMFACNTKKEEPAAAVVDTAQIKKEIQAKEDEFAAAYNSGELKNIGYYADDATVLFSKQGTISRQTGNYRVFKIRFKFKFQ